MLLATRDSASGVGFPPPPVGPYSLAEPGVILLQVAARRARGEEAAVCQGREDYRVTI